MKTIALVFHSQFGNTKRLAEAFVKGATSIKDSHVFVHELSNSEISTAGTWENDDVLKVLTNADAIVFASPTYMGNVSGLFKLFADATVPIWMERAWMDKIAGGMTTSGHPSGDKLSTLQYMALFAFQHRMIWVGPSEHGSDITGDQRNIDQWGFWLGVGAEGSITSDDKPDLGDLHTAEEYGKRIASIMWRFSDDNH